ncbi:MAG: leucine-rich repeat domain-containing protein [Candidatus Zixiibacteriota bacterium]
MKHTTILKITGLVILTVALLAGCSDKITNDSSPTVSVKLQAPIASTGSAAVVNLFALTVTGPDMEPVMAYRWYEGGPLVFELDVPAGSNRLFVLEGISAGPEFDFTSPLEDVLYRGSATADIEPGETVDLSIQLLPVVPLFRVNPYLTQVESGQPFALTVEAFNLGGLKDAEVGILFDPTIIAFDSLQKGSTLDPNDVVEITGSRTDPGLQLLISDPNISTGEIVDSNGYSDMLTLHMRSLVTLDAGARYVDIAPLGLVSVSGDSIPVAGVYSQAATVDIGAYTQPLVRLYPSTTEIASRESFAVDVELVNLAGLRSASLTVMYDYSMITPDSVVKGTDLTSTDVFSPFIGETQVQISISNSTETIVDSDLPTKVATLYFTIPYIFNGASNPDGVILVETSTQMVFQLGAFENLDLTRIPPDDITTLPGTVVITPIADSIVTFPDSGLESLVRWSIGDQTTDPLWLSDVIFIDSLDGWGGEMQIETIEGVQVLENLTRLFLDGNLITDIAPLEYLTNISVLNLDNNSIVDITPLVNNPGLAENDTLYIAGNPLSESAIAVDIPALEARGVTVYWMAAY